LIEYAIMPLRHWYFHITPLSLMITPLRHYDAIAAIIIYWLLHYAIDITFSHYYAIIASAIIDTPLPPAILSYFHYCHIDYAITLILRHYFIAIIEIITPLLHYWYWYIIIIRHIITLLPAEYIPIDEVL
jgi:hypothetical protein